jgi:small-conductance mechanosensitive channel
MLDLELLTNHFWQITTLIIGFASVFLLAWILNTVISKQASKVIERSPSLKTTYIFLRRLILGTIILIGASSVTFAVFPSLGMAIASLFVAAGFASIVIGLAAQSTLSNLIAGITISLSQPFKLNDAVVFKGDFCFVEDIRLMYTVLRSWDNRRLMVPNSIIQSDVVINYTAQDPTMLVPVYVAISYESDLEKAMRIMVDVAKRHPDCLPIGDLPNVVVMDFENSGIKLRLLSRAKDQPTAFMMARDLLKEIKRAFDANGIEIPYPRTYLVLEPKALEALKQLTDSFKLLREDQVKGKTN